MKRLLTAVIAGSVLLGALPALAQQRITIDGSSTVFPVTEAVAEEFQKASKGQTRVTVGISGTGGGFKKFCRGESDISNASRPILEGGNEGLPRSRCRIHRAAGRLRRPHRGGQPAERLVRVDHRGGAEEDLGAGRPGQDHAAGATSAQAGRAEINLYGAGADSGTFDYFTEAIVGKAKSSRGDFTASEDDNVLVQGISNDKNALGYFRYAYYAANPDKLKAVAIDEGKGQAVLPCPETVKGGTYNPLSRPLFIYVKEKRRRSAAGQTVRRVLHDEGPGAGEGGQVRPVAGSGLQDVAGALPRRQVGTAFGGKPEVGLRSRRSSSGSQVLDYAFARAGVRRHARPSTSRPANVDRFSSPEVRKRTQASQNPRARHRDRPVLWRRPHRC